MNTTTYATTERGKTVHLTDESGSILPQLIEKARKMGPLLLENAPIAERERRLPKVVFDALAAAGFQRMMTPRSLGGLELDPVSVARVIEEVAMFDSAAGWALQPGNTGGWWAARLPADEASQTYSQNPNAMVAAALHPPQQATRVPGGFRVSGRSPLASNIHDADWLLVSALVMEDGRPRFIDGHPEVIAVIVPSADVEIIDTWYTLGMRGTDSNDVKLDDVFVPKSRSYALVPEFERPAHFAGPLYRFPAVGVTAVTVVPVALAAGRGAINELRALASNKTQFGFNKTLAERSNTQATLARAEGILRSARLLFYSTLSDVWSTVAAGESATMEQRADVLLAAVHAAKSAAEVAELMHRLAGTSGIYQSSKLERHFRDAHTLRHHGFVSESKLDSVGQIYLGQPPEFMMLAF
ncbi:MAG: acyl-CoA dehydrogenase family protein [Gemmatimonadota bacterium]